MEALHPVACSTPRGIPHVSSGEPLPRRSVLLNPPSRSTSATSAADGPLQWHEGQKRFAMHFFFGID